jgi:hypothetical protein
MLMVCQHGDPYTKEVKQMDKTIQKIENVLPEGKPLKGESVKVKDLVGAQIIIESAEFRPSQYSDGDYAAVQAERGGMKIWFNADQTVILRQLQKLVEMKALPIYCTVEQRKSELGRSYYVLGSCGPLKKEASKEDASKGRGDYLLRL